MGSSTVKMLLLSHIHIGLVNSTDISKSVFTKENLKVGMKLTKSQKVMVFRWQQGKLLCQTILIFFQERFLTIMNLYNFIKATQATQKMDNWNNLKAILSFLWPIKAEKWTNVFKNMEKTPTNSFWLHKMKNAY